MKHIDDVVRNLIANAALPLRAAPGLDRALVARHVEAFDQAAEHLSSIPGAAISRTLCSASIQTEHMRVWLNHNRDANIPQTLEIHVREPSDSPPDIAVIQMSDPVGFNDLPGGPVFDLAIGACRAAAASCRALLDPSNAAEADRRLDLVHRIVGALALEHAHGAGGTATKARAKVADPSRYAHAMVEIDRRNYSDVSLPIGNMLEDLVVRAADWDGAKATFLPMSVVMTESQLSPGPVGEIAMVRALAERRACA